MRSAKVRAVAFTALLLLQGFALPQATGSLDQEGIAGNPSATATGEALNATGYAGLQMLYHEGFEGPGSLVDRGFVEETLREAAAWKILNRDRPPVLVGGNNPVVVYLGNQSVGLLDARGSYQPGLETRLVSPIIDLRYVLGASQSPDEPTRQEVLRAARAQARALFEGSVSSSSGPLSLVSKQSYLLYSDASELDYVFVPRGLADPFDALANPLGFVTNTVPGSAGQVAGDAIAFNFATRQQSTRNPVQERVGGSMVNLTFFHKYNFSVGDGAFLEIRERGGNSWSGWIALTPDTFADNTTLPASSVGDPESSGGNGRQSGRYSDPGPAEFSIAENAWLKDSGGLVKSHFTLNRYAGREVQLAFHFVSQSARVVTTGWFIDDINVTAPVPPRDVYVRSIDAPVAGDIAPEGYAFAPKATVRNNGFLAAKNVSVSFAVSRVVAGAGVPVFNETVRISALGPQEEVHVRSQATFQPSSAGEHRLKVTSSVSADAQADALAAANETEADAYGANNEQVVAFTVRDVKGAGVMSGVASESRDSVLADVGEDKTFLVTVHNRGNVPATGSLRAAIVGVDPRDPRIAISAPVELLPDDGVSLTVPFGRDVFSLGGATGSVEKKFRWGSENREPGLYRFSAAFSLADGTTIPSNDLLTYVRQVPLAYLSEGAEALSDGSDGFPAASTGRLSVGPGGDRWSTIAVVDIAKSVASPVIRPTLREIVSPPYAFEATARDDDGTLVANQGVPGGTATGRALVTAVNESDAGKRSIYDDYYLATEVDLVPYAGYLDASLGFWHEGGFFWVEELATDAPNGTRTKGAIEVRVDTAATTPAEAADVVPPNTTHVLVNFTEPTEGWRHETVSLKKFLGSKVTLLFHFKSTPRRLETATPETSAFCAPPGGGSVSTCSTAEPEIGTWLVDNIRVDVTRAAVVDGQRRAGAISTPYRANVSEADDSLSFYDPVNSCLHAYEEGSSRLRVNGTRCGTANAGWSVATREGELFPSYWHLDDRCGRRSPNEAAPTTTSIRFSAITGAQGSIFECRNELYPEPGVYSVLATPLIDLSAASRPMLIFDHNYSFSPATTEDAGSSALGSKPLYKDGGAVWVAVYDDSDAFLYRELATPAPDSPDTYRGSIYTAGEQARFRDLPIMRSYEKYEPLLTPEGGSCQDLASQVICRRNSTLFVLRSGVAIWEGSNASTEGARWVEARFDLTSYAGKRVRIEFHGVDQNGAEAVNWAQSGWQIDNVRLLERAPANDVGVSSLALPLPGSRVGVGRDVFVFARITNFGVFPQRGVGVYYNVTYLNGTRVHPLDSAAVFQRTPAASTADAIAGLRTEGANRNVTLKFAESWRPAEDGVYRINVWTGLDSAVDPYPDENPTNDLFSQEITVKNVRDPALLSVEDLPDAEVVTPALAASNVPRTIKAVVANRGTLVEDFSRQGAGGQFYVEAKVTNEQGDSVLASPLRRDLALLDVGAETIVEFRDAWVPAGAGTYRIEIILANPQDSDLTNNVRILYHTVFDRLAPPAGIELDRALTPDSPIWGAATGSDGALAWHFGEADGYKPGSSGSLVLSQAIDSATVRSAYAALVHTYDFEPGYDGGRLEASLDGGLTWIPAEPDGGYPAGLTTASPFVADPDDPKGAFSGDSGGRRIDLFNLGRIGELTEAAELFNDTLDGSGPPQILGDWRQETHTMRSPTGGKFLFSDGVPPLDWTRQVGIAQPLDKSTTDSQKYLNATIDLAKVSRSDLDASRLVVAFDDWRAIGIASRAARQPAPNGVCVLLHDSSGLLLEQVSPLPCTTSDDQLYDNNYRDWTANELKVDGKALPQEAVTLSFLHRLASGAARSNLFTDAHNSTDGISPHVGWAIDNVRVFLVFQDGRGERDLLRLDDFEYDGVEALERAGWSGSYHTYAQYGTFQASDTRGVPPQPLFVEDAGRGFSSSFKLATHVTGPRVVNSYEPDPTTAGVWDLSGAGSVSPGLAEAARGGSILFADGAGRVFALGGESGGEGLGDVAGFVPDSGVSVALGDGFPRESGISGAWLGDAGYLLGGSTGTTLSAIAPQPVGALGAARSGAAIATAIDPNSGEFTAFLLGGFDGLAHRKDIELYVPSTGSGSTAAFAQLPRGLSGAGAAAVAPIASTGGLSGDPCDLGCVLVFGGHDGSAYSDEILRFSFSEGTVNAAGERLPRPMAHMATVFDPRPLENNVCARGCVYLLGGADAAGPLDTILRYDPSAGKLVELPTKLPAPLSRSAGVLNEAAGTIYLFGGDDASGPQDSIVSYTPADPGGGRLESVAVHAAKLPSPRSGASAVWTGTAALVFGGRSGSARTGEIVAFDPVGTVSSMPVELPTARTETVAFWAGALAYILGGSDSAPLATILRYNPTVTEAPSSLVYGFDPDELTVKPLATIGAVRDDSAAAGVAESVYFFGGRDGEVLDASVLTFTPATGLIEHLPTSADLPTARHGAVAVASGGFIYVFGGYDGSFRRDVLRFDPATSTTTTLSAQLPSGRSQIAAAEAGGAIYLFGGYDGAFLDEVLRFDPSAGSLSVLGVELPTPRTTSAVASSDSIFLVGGAFESGPIADVLKFDPATSAITDSRLRLPPIEPDRAHQARLFGDATLVTAASGPFVGSGKALELAGTGHAVVSPLGLVITGPFKVALWVRTGAANAALVSKTNPTNASDDAFALSLASGKPRIELARYNADDDAPETVLCSAEDNVADSGWHHLSAGRDGDDKAFVEVDGVTTTCETALSGPLAGQGNLMIGKIPASSAFVGMVDQLEVTVGGERLMLFAFDEELDDAVAPTANPAPTAPIAPPLFVSGSVDFAVGEDAPVGDLARVALFKGVGEGFLYASHTDSLNAPAGGANLTVEIWAQTGRPDGVLLSKTVAGPDGYPVGYELGVKLGKPYFYVSANGDHVLCPGIFPVADRLWHHIVGSQSPELGAARLYVDGELVGACLGSPQVPLTGTGPLLVGAGKLAGAFEGNLSEVRIAGGARSPLIGGDDVRYSVAGGWKQIRSGGGAYYASGPGTDSRLVTPLELGNSVGDVRLAITHAFSFEYFAYSAGLVTVNGGQSGGRLEVSADEGGSWVAIEPELPAITGLPHARYVPLFAYTDPFTGKAAQDLATYTPMGGLAGDPELDSRFGAGSRVFSGASGCGVSSPCRTGAQTLTTSFNLSQFAGKRILVAFRAFFTTGEFANDDFWRIDSVRVTGAVVKPVDNLLLRLRALTDASGSGGGWEVHDFEVFGLRQPDNVRVRIIEPVPGALVKDQTRGSNTVFVTVVNRGPSPVTANLTVEVVGPDDTSSLKRLSATDALVLGPGESRVVDSLAGVSLTWLARAGREYTVFANLTHRDEGREQLIYDNADRVLIPADRVVDKSRLEVKRLALSPNSFDPLGSDDLRVVAEVRNEGLDPVSVRSLDLNITSGDGGRAARFNEGDLANFDGYFGAGLATRLFEWRIPAQKLAELPSGLYEANVTVTNQVTGPSGAAEVVADWRVTRLYLGENVVKDIQLYHEFDEDSFDNPSNPYSWMPATFVLNQRYNHTPDWSTSFGGPGNPITVEGCGGGAGEPGEPPPTPVTGLLGTPAIRLDSMSHPILRYFQSYQIPERPEASGVLNFRFWDPDSSDGDGGAFQAITNWDGNSFAPERVNGTSSAWAAGRFDPKVVDLEHSVSVGTEKRYVQVQFAITVPLCTTTGGWMLDDVMLSSNNVSLGPDQSFTVSDDTDKSYLLRLSNTGEYSDRYGLAFTNERGEPIIIPPEWQVSATGPNGEMLVDSMLRSNQSLELDPGESKVIKARIVIPPQDTSRRSSGAVSLKLTAFSVATPALRTTASLDAAFEYADKPNLFIDAAHIIADATLPVNQPRTVEVTILNTGVGDATGVEVTVKDRVAGQPETSLRQLDGSALQPVNVPALGLRTISAYWNPTVAGTHTIIVELDPNSKIVETDRRDNSAMKTVTISKARFPDLSISVVATPTHPRVGDVVDFDVYITNQGAEEAKGVQFIALIGATDLLPGDPPHFLARPISPGDTVKETLQWQAVFPGKFTLFLRAVPKAGVVERVETEEDNTLVAEMNVRSQGLVASLLGNGTTLAQGGSSTLPVRVENRGNSADTYLFALDLPRRWTGLVSIGDRTVRQMMMGNGTSEVVTVELSAAVNAVAGTYAPVLVVVSQNTSQTVRVPLPVEVGVRHELRASKAAATGPPGLLVLPVPLENLGNGDEDYTVSLKSAPFGWNAAPATGTIPPYGKTTAELRLVVPGNARPDLYVLELRVDGEVARITVGAGVTITTQAIVAVSHAAPVVTLRPMTSADLDLFVDNAGNVKTAARIDFRLPLGWKAAADRESVVLGVGESKGIKFSVYVPDGEVPGDYSVSTTAVTDDGASHVSRVVFRVRAPDLAISDLQITPRFNIKPGTPVSVSAAVVNEGDLSVAEVPVALYVDDRLVDVRNLPDVAPGEPQYLTFEWTAVAGNHLLLLVVDPGSAISEYDKDDNTRFATLDAGPAGAGVLPGLDRNVPGAPLEAILLVIAAVAWSWRKRRG